MKIYTLKKETPTDFYEVTVNGKQAPVYTHFVSAYPINRRWPGHQREISQREKSYFVAFENDEGAEICVKSRKPGVPIVRPVSENVCVNESENGYTFRLNKHGAYSFETGDGHANLHLFFNRPAAYSFTRNEKVIRYEGGTFDAGEIVLHSDETLYVAEDAVLHCNIVAENAENVRICGRGILDNSNSKEKILFDVNTGDGQADVGNAVRKHFISLNNCKNVTISGVTLRDSLCYNVSAVNVDGFYCNDVKIIGCWRYNSDGIDMQNCRNAHVSNCFVRTYDDCICVKGDRGVRTNCEHILVENCVFWCDWGHAMEIGLETCADKITDIRYRDCTVMRTNFDFLHIGCADYAEISDVSYENINLEFTGDEREPYYQKADGEEYPANNTPYSPALLGIGIFHHFEYSVGDKFGRIHGVKYKNITVTGAKGKPKITVNGADETHTVPDVTLETVTINGKRATSLSDFETEIGYGENIIIK